MFSLLELFSSYFSIGTHSKYSEFCVLFLLLLVGFLQTTVSSFHSFNIVDYLCVYAIQIYKTRKSVIISNFSKVFKKAAIIAGEIS